jgi:hypothetical protein
MITLDDIEDMTDLNRGEIAALAEHEHLGDYDATILGNYLLHIHHGPHTVQRMISEDVREALHKGDVGHARTLFETLRHFIAMHPEAVRGSDR